MPLGYELVADSGVLASAVTQYNFTGLNFTSDDVLMLVSDIYNNNSGSNNFYLYVNATSSGYYEQLLNANGSSVVAARFGLSVINGMNGFNRTITKADIKLTEAGYFTYVGKQQKWYDSGSQMPIDITHVTSTFTITSIDSLRIQSVNSNGIGTGSRFKLYKLIAEPLADITVTSDTTQVDITDLNLGETNELLLVSDIQNNTSNSLYRILFNGNTTPSNYYSQGLEANGTSVSASRDNEPRTSFITNGESVLSITKIKLTNSGYLSWQTNIVRFIGGASIRILSYYGSSTFTASSITTISIQSVVTNAIGTGSRFKLYKLK